MDPILWLEAALESFDSDPPDSDYQRGYQAALQEVYDLLNEVV
jgi:hypothetical protein